MDHGYEQIVIVGLVFYLVPSAVLAVWLRPKPWMNVFRGGEAGGYLGFAIDSLRRLLLIGAGTAVLFPPDMPLPLTDYEVPGEWIALLNVSLIAMSATLFWCRVSQKIRHKTRNRDTEQRFLDHIAKDE